MKPAPNKPCPCHSGRKYKQCCRPFHQGQWPSTPLALMRSRYAAYALRNVAYVIETTHPDSPHYQANSLEWPASLGQFCDQTDFAGLEIQAQEMADDPDQGWVTFKAILFQNERDVSYVERSLFQKLEGRWLYVFQNPSPWGRD